MKPSRVIRRPSEKQLAKLREQIAIRKTKASLKQQQKTQARKEVEKYQNIYKKEINAIKERYKSASPLEKANLTKMIKNAIKVHKTLVLPNEKESLGSFQKRLEALGKWDFYSISLFVRVISLATEYNVLVNELTAWATPVIENTIPFNNAIRAQAETIIQVFYQFENGVISIATLKDNIIRIIGA